jgi:hypothetical protein
VLCTNIIQYPHIPWLISPHIPITRVGKITQKSLGLNFKNNQRWWDGCRFMGIGAGSHHQPCVEGRTRINDWRSHDSFRYSMVRTTGMSQSWVPTQTPSLRIFPLFHRRSIYFDPLLPRPRTQFQSEPGHCNFSCRSTACAWSPQGVRTADQAFKDPWELPEPWILPFA